MSPEVLAARLGLALGFGLAGGTLAAAVAAHAVTAATEPPGRHRSPSLSVRLTEPRHPYWVGAVTFTATVESPPGDPVVRVAFTLDGAGIGAVSSAPYRIVHDFRDTLAPHRLSITATAASGASATALAVSLGASLQQSAGVELVLVPVSVFGADGLPVRGLGRNDFTLFDDGIRQRISTFDSEPTPVSLAFGLDCSGSMQPYFPFVKAAAIRFVQKLPAFFGVSLTSFAGTPERVCDFTFDRAHLFYEINHRRAEGGGTALLGASRAIIASLRSRPGRRVAAIFTDGQDTVVPEEKADEVARKVLSDARAAGVMIFYVGYGWIDETRRLERIATATGGEYLPAGGRPLEQAFDRIARNLSSQYTLGFEPARPGLAGEWRTVRVLVARPGLTVSARPGYAIPASPK